MEVCVGLDFSVCDFVHFCLRLSSARSSGAWTLLIFIALVKEIQISDLQFRSSEALLIVYVFSVGLFAVTQVLYDDHDRDGHDEKHLKP